MAEDAKKTDPNETGSAKTDGQTNPDGEKKPENKSEVIKTEGFDPSSLKDEDFDKIFADERLYKHGRFKSLSERAKKADELEKAQTEAEAEQLKKSKKFEELYEKTEAQRKELEQKVQDITLNSMIQSKASVLGIVDLEAAAMLIDKSLIKMESDKIEGVDEALDKLLKDKPYLVSKEQQQAVGTGTNPSSKQTEAGTKRYKLSQIKDHKFWQENEKDILEASKLGLIEDDTAQA